MKEKLEKLNKEKQDLIRSLDNDPENEELKRQKKNITERIRVLTKNILAESEIEKSKNVEVKQEKKSKETMKSVVQKHMNEMTAEQIAEKFNYPLASVKWYFNKLK